MKMTNDVETPPANGLVTREKNMRFTYPGGSRPLEGYTIKRGIGIGGFGEVYFALSDAGKEVALKRIQRNLDVELRGVRQCLNLKHVNLIKLWDIRENDAGESWVVMEYVPGESLRDVIDRHPQGMPEDQVLRWIEMTLAGVAYLHDRGIVHRDLKPGNIFHDVDENTIKIGDYGLAKFISCSNRDAQTETVGTFHYMAPEISKGAYGKEIDIYAVGIIFHEMLTGRVPFDGESTQEIVMKHLTAMPDLDGLPTRFRTVVEKGLAKDPRRRFSSASEMWNAIQNAVNGIEVISRGDVEVPPVAVKPAVQPMFIGELDNSQDPGIRFGKLREGADASASNDPVRRNPEFERTQPHRSSASMAGVPEEPVARMVHGGWHRVIAWWNDSSMNTPVKVVLLVIIGAILLANLAWLLPLAATLGLTYLAYIGIRSLTKSSSPVNEKPRKKNREDARARLRSSLAARPAADRTTELVGSLVVSCVASLVLGFFAILALPAGLVENGRTGAWYVWIVVTAITACWSLLTVSKTWEHREGESLVRRGVLMCCGALTGLVSWLVGDYLHLQWDGHSSLSDSRLSPFPEGILDGVNGPTLAASVLFVGVLFFVLRWWKLADPLRRSRIGIFRTALCVAFAAMVGEIFRFPLPWSCVVAFMVAISCQFAAPWIGPEQRKVGSVADAPLRI
jgi:serine/threonine protein kinase